VEIVPDMYPYLLFGDVPWKPLKITEQGVHWPAFSKYSCLTPSRGWQRVRVGDMTNWHTLMVQIHLVCLFVTLRILKKGDDLTIVIFILFTFTNKQ
jgi:hypothetical protein